MSHFSVFVFTKDKPDEAALAKIMRPFHEYECTGWDDEYVVDVDVTDKMKADHAEHGDGAPFSPAWVARWSGAIHRDGRYYRRTNPNKKWDWYSVGGRWTGHLVPHYDPHEDPDNKQICRLCRGTGKREDQKCNGCRGTGIETKWPTQWKSVGDQARLVDVPLFELRDLAERKALALYDQVMAVVSRAAGTSKELAYTAIPSWNLVRDQYASVEQARSAYPAHPVVRAVRDAKNEQGESVVDPWTDLDQFGVSREACARSARAGAFCPFAVITPEGKWYERGEMGWWATVFNEKDHDTWADEFTKLVDAMDPQTWVTVVDCHI